LFLAVLWFAPIAEANRLEAAIQASAEEVVAELATPSGKAVEA
jgi:hypothetical protein